jgi:hypothetical protein
MPQVVHGRSFAHTGCYDAAPDAIAEFAQEGVG